MIRFVGRGRTGRPRTGAAAGLVGALVLVCGASRSSAAVSDYVGKPVGSVRLTVEDRETTDPSLTRVVATAVGEPLSMAAVRESISHLFSLGRFEGVRVDAALDNGRVSLRYALSPIHPVTHIQFAGPGAPGVDEGALRRAITDRYGATPPLARAPDMVRIVEAVLAERGYLHATATPQARVEHEPEQASLTFTITPNTRTTIGAVNVVGEPTVTHAELVRRLGLTRGTPFQRDRLDANIVRYVAERRTRGYYEARVVPIVTLADEDRIADVTVDVRPGPHIRVVFTGDDVPSARRDDLVPVEREGSVDEDLLEDSSNRIEEYFRSQGYRGASAPHTRDDRDGEQLVTFAVKKGPLNRVTVYDISGNTAVPTEEISPLLKLRVGQPFAESRLDADVQTIETLYRRRGFATARARTAVEPQTAGATSDEVPVVVRTVVTEGARTTVESIAMEGNTAVPTPALRARIALQVGAPYVPSQLAADRDAIQLTYQDIGYQSVTIDATPQFSDDQSHAALRFRIQEGPRIFVGHVLIVGNVRTRTETIERALQVKSGDAFSLSAINEGQRRLASLGLFRRVRISELRQGTETTRDLLVTVEEAPPTTIAYGLGAQAGRLVETSNGVTTDRFDIAPRALFEIGRRNLFGKNRSANLFTSVGRSVVSNLTEYRVVATFREPRLFDTSADAFLTGTLEQQHRSTFDFSRRSFSANIERRFSGAYRITGAYQLQRTSVFNLNIDDPNLPFIDRAFQQFLLSSFSGSLIRDTRDDALDTHGGTYVSANTQLALSALGSEVGFVKSFFTAQMFRPIPHERRLVFAGSARLGVATGFTDTRSGVTDVTTAGQLPASERFFAGGDTTVRGFLLDQLGVRHTPTQPGDTVDQNGFGIGGNGLVIFNGELRAAVTGGFGVVGFVDTGNVFAQAGDINLTELRTAVGGGVRYKSPVGPLRIDLGFKVNRQPGESRSAWFVSFGQAF
jgi:outer membrane protein insertion porin family